MPPPAIWHLRRTTLVVRRGKGVSPLGLEVFLVVPPALGLRTHCGFSIFNQTNVSVDLPNVLLNWRRYVFDIGLDTRLHDVCCSIPCRHRCRHLQPLRSPRLEFMRLFMFAMNWWRKVNSENLILRVGNSESGRLVKHPAHSLSVAPGSCHRWPIFGTLLTCAGSLPPSPADSRKYQEYDRSGGLIRASERD